MKNLVRGLVNSHIGACSLDGVFSPAKLFRKFWEFEIFTKKFDFVKCEGGTVL